MIKLDKKDWQKWIYLAHVDENNYPKMVDIGLKESTKQMVAASGIIKIWQFMIW